MSSAKFTQKTLQLPFTTFLYSPIKIVFYLLATCELPPDYVYNTVTRKSYRPVCETKDWFGARAACEADGASLLEHRTVEEREVFYEMFRKFQERGLVTTGVTKRISD